jgi:hypothetical protein
MEMIMKNPHSVNEIVKEMAKILGLFKKADMWWNEFMADMNSAKTCDDWQNIHNKWLIGRYLALLEGENKHIMAKQEVLQRLPQGCKIK